MSEPLRKLEDWLTSHVLGPERRLPPERRLAEALGLSRAELRKALAVLETENRLIRHVGRGTFLRPPGGADLSAVDASGADRSGGPPTPSWAEMVGDLASPRDLFQARLALEPEIARAAALQASRAALREIDGHAAAVRAAISWETYDAADLRFHRAIALASGSGLLLALHDVLADVGRVVPWGRLLARGSAPSPGQGCHAEHDAVRDALGARDRHAAAEASRHHVMVEAAALFGSFP